jgi:hypothetical protein
MDGIRHRFMQPPKTAADCPSYVPAVIDTVGAAGIGALAVDAYMHRNDADSAADLFMVPIAVGAVLFAAAAVHGYLAPGRCEDTLAQ